MEWAFGMFVIIMVCGIYGKVSDLEDKMDDLINEDIKAKSKFIKDDILNDYKDKVIHLEVDNDDINNGYLFDAGESTEGTIVDFDNIWIAFKYYSKEQKREVIQYFRRHDIKSINEIK